MLKQNLKKKEKRESEKNRYIIYGRKREKKQTDKKHIARKVVVFILRKNKHILWSFDLRIFLREPIKILDPFESCDIKQLKNLFTN